MISDRIRVRGASHLPETVITSFVGMKASDVIESRFLRSAHAREAVIAEVLGIAQDGALYMRLDRPIGSPVIPSVRKDDPIALMPSSTRTRYISPLEAWK